MGAPLRVLIVDDEKDIRTTLAVCLQGLGCATSEATGAEAALSAVARQTFDVRIVKINGAERRGRRCVWG
jgi:NtrC-family two-component system response regulator AlgB